MAVSLGSVNKGLIVIYLGGEGGGAPLCIQHSSPIVAVRPSSHQHFKVGSRGTNWATERIRGTKKGVLLCRCQHPPPPHCPTPLWNNAPLFRCPTPTKTSGLFMSVSSVSRNTRPTFDRL